MWFFFLQRRRVSHTEESIPHSGTSTDVPAKVSTQLLFSACVPRPERNRRVRKESWTFARFKSFPACSNRIVFRRQNRPDEGYCQSTALRLFSCSTWNIAGFPRLFGSEVFHVEHRRFSPFVWLRGVPRGTSPVFPVCLAPRCSTWNIYPDVRRIEVGRRRFPVPRGTLPVPPCVGPRGVFHVEQLP